MSRMNEIETRLLAIKGELELDNADLEALTKETEALLEERKGLLDAIEQRKLLLSKIANDNTLQTLERQDENKMERNKGIESLEYRSAFLNQLRNLELSEVEQRALTTATSSVGAVIPTQTSNKIVEKLKQYAPLLDKVEKLSVQGNITIPTEGTTIDAKIHAQGTTITADADTLGSVTLGAYEVTKLVTISKSVMTMSIDAFEEWITTKIAKKLGEKISALILNGTGSSEAQGINAITWNESNSITVAKAGSLTEKNVTDLVALYNGAYFGGSEWLMSSTTFFGDFYPLMNTGKNNAVTESNGEYRIMGRPVTFDDRVTAHEAFLANLYEGYAANVAENPTITSQFVTRENSFDFLGSTMMDGKVKAVEAFCKIVKATE